MRTGSMCSPGKVWELSAFPKKEAHSCSSSFCPRPQIISCKAPSLGVLHTSCFVSYTTWANHSIKELLIMAAHHFFLRISLGAITHLTLLWFGVTWCLCPCFTSQERAGSCSAAGVGLAPSWQGFLGVWVNEVICYSISHISYVFLM